MQSSIYGKSFAVENFVSVVVLSAITDVILSPMIEVDVDKELHSVHLIEKHEKGLHTISVDCECNPDNFRMNRNGEDNVFVHQRISSNNKNKAAKYSRYLLFIDNDVILDAEE